MSQVALLRTLNINYPALTDGVCSTLHPYLEVILCLGDLGSNMRPSGARIKSGGITHPGLPGMSSTPPRSGVGFGIGIGADILSARSASDRDG